MEIDRKLVEKVASVARLSLTDKEIEMFIPQLREIIRAFSKIDEVDTSSAKPAFQPVVIRNAMRDDINGKCLTQQEALSNTEHKQDGYFKGPRAV